MDRPLQNKKRDRRMAVLYGVVGGFLLFGGTTWMTNGMLQDPSAPPTPPRHLLFLGDISGWPPYLTTFWPLNLLAVCFWFTLLMYLVLFKFDPTHNPRSVKEFALRALGLFSVFGAFGGVMMTMTGGWVNGIEGYFLMGTLMSAVMIALMAFLGAVFGAGYLLYRGAQAVWPRIRNRRFMRPFLRIARYFNGEDEPAAPSHSV